MDQWKILSNAVKIPLLDKLTKEEYEKWNIVYQSYKVSMTGNTLIIPQHELVTAQLKAQITMWQSFENDNRPYGEAVFTDFIKRLFKKRDRVSVLQELKQVKMKGWDMPSYLQYVREFDECIKRISSDYDGEAEVEVFVQGLSPEELRVKCSHENLKKIKDIQATAYKFVKENEDSVGKVYSGNIMRGKGSFGHDAGKGAVGFVKCFKCGGAHYQKHCPNGNGKLKRKFSDIDQDNNSQSLLKPSDSNKRLFHRQSNNLQFTRNNNNLNNQFRNYNNKKFRNGNKQDQPNNSKQQLPLLMLPSSQALNLIPNTQTANNSEPASKQIDNGTEGITCYNCQEKGHFANQCPHPRLKKNNKDSKRKQEK